MEIMDWKKAISKSIELIAVTRRMVKLCDDVSVDEVDEYIASEGKRQIEIMDEKDAFALLSFFLERIKLCLEMPGQMEVDDVLV